MPQFCGCAEHDQKCYSLGENGEREAACANCCKYYNSAELMVSVFGCPTDLRWGYFIDLLVHLCLARLALKSPATFHPVTSQVIYVQPSKEIEIEIDRY